MTIEKFICDYPDFSGSVDKARRYWKRDYQKDAEVTFWDLLAEAPAWLFGNEYDEWYDRVGEEHNGPMGDFMEDYATEGDIHAIVPRVRDALGRKPPVVDYKYTRDQLVHELEAVASDAMSEGESYAPQNSWAIALYQAAAIISGDEHCNDDEIRVCNAQYRHLEGLNLSDVCNPNICYEPLWKEEMRGPACHDGHHR